MNESREDLIGSSSSLGRSKGSADLFSDISIGEEDIKRRLDWYFKTPYGKYKERGRKPFKLLMQIVKIVLVTVQATWFALEEFSLVKFESDNLDTFRHLFLADSSDASSTLLYSRDAVYRHMFHAWKKYYTMEDNIIGSYIPLHSNATTMAPIKFCYTWHDHLKKLLQRGVEEDFADHEDSEEYGDTLGDIDDDTNKYCTYLKPPDKHLGINGTTFIDFVEGNDLPVRLGWVLSLTMEWAFHSNDTGKHHPSETPHCYTFNVILHFDNPDLDGTMSMDLTSKVRFYRCNEGISAVSLLENEKAGQTLFGLIIIVICIISIVLCVRSFKKHYYVYKYADRFFQEYRHEKLQLSDKVVFVSYWYVLIVFADIFAVCGCVLKIIIDLVEAPQLYSICSIGFGLAVLFSWLGILRYLGFLRHYNTLLITLQVAFPHILRFICCVSFIYMGFVLCGWIVLGPYHEKFASIILSSECLYSLLNGDDMFNTYMLIYDRTDDPLIVYFSKVYLYVFISLFIFVILSLFIGIVEDTFDKITEDGCAPKTRVQLFMEGREYTDDAAADEASSS